MGVIGKQALGWLGRKAGEFAGKKLGKYTGIGADRGGSTGQSIGELLGELLPFKKGGRVPRTGKALVHKGEFVLPKGVRPTKKQVAAVRKRGGRVSKPRKRKGRKWPIWWGVEPSLGV